MADPPRPERVGIVQRLVADYRVPFFEALQARLGCAVSVFAGRPRANEAISTGRLGDQVQQCEARNFYLPTPAGFLCWQRGLAAWLGEFDPQIAVADANPRLVSNRRLLGRMHARGRPVLGWGLGRLQGGAPPPISAIRSWYSAAWARRFDGVIAYGTKAGEDYARMGVAESKIFVARNAVASGTSVRRTRPGDGQGPTDQAWREGLGLDAGLPVVLFVGRLIPEKRLPDLFEAAAGIGSRCQVLVVGDGPERAKLEARARSFDSVRIRFAGSLHGEGLVSCFRGSALFVLPGTGGLAVHEAMAHGLPVVVTVADGTERDLVEDGASGLLLEPGDPAALRRAIGRILDDPALRESMGRRALARVRDELNLEKMVDSFEDAILTTFERSAGTRSTGTRSAGK